VSGAADADFTDLYREHFAFVWRILRRMGVPFAQLEDAAQEVFVVVHRRRDRWTHGSARSWLFGIARRVASDVRRGNRRSDRRLRAVADLPPVRRDFSGAIEAASFVAQALELMDPDKRMVFVLADVEGLTAAEIGEALQINVNTIYARLRAARKIFKEARARMEPKADGPERPVRLPGSGQS
jgi:RNA polymerase sigma-70 factor (ECF subfamily)